MRNRRNYYRVLHVQPDAPAEIIRTSYRTLMHRLRMHPDLGGDDWNAAVINEAFETLSDPAKRARYDATLRQAAAMRAPGAAEAARTSRRPLPAPATATSACPFCATLHTAREAALPGSACASCGSPLFPAVRLQHEDASRRALDRLPRQMDVSFCLAWPTQHAFTGTTEDISISGMRFATDVALRVGDRLRLDSDFCSAIAIVRSAQRAGDAGRPWQVGVEFLTLRIKRARGGLVSKKI